MLYQLQIIPFIGHKSLNINPNKPFLLLFRLYLKGPRRKQKKKIKTKPVLLSVMALLSSSPMLYHFIRHALVHSLSLFLYLSPFIYHSCPSLLSLSILPIFPRSITDYEELTLLQIVTQKRTPLSYGGPSWLLFGRLYHSHTVEQTVRLNR